jgi:hypothetical protein
MAKTSLPAIETTTVLGRMLAMPTTLSLEKRTTMIGRPVEFWKMVLTMACEKEPGCCVLGNNNRSERALLAVS